MAYLPKTEKCIGRLRKQLRRDVHPRYVDDRERKKPRRKRPSSKKVACLQIALRSLYGDSYPFSTFVENMKKVL